MTGATGNFYCGLHESEDMAFVLHFLQPGDVFYDIGANVGSYSLLAAAAGVTSIHSFEPSSATSLRLRRTISLNSLGQSVTVHQFALGAEDGEAKLSLHQDTTNHVLSEDDDQTPAESVQIHRFDDVFVHGQSSFIKMDVEGFESAVLSGATLALADPALLGLLIEDNGSDRRYREHGSVEALLCAQGFSAFSYDPISRTLLSANQLQRTGGNILFLRSGIDAAARVASAPRHELITGWI